MFYRTLGGTNLKVSAIGIGGGAFFGPRKTTKQVTEIVRFAVKNGINLIETAEDYDETKLAPVLNEVRKKVILISKSFASSKKEIEASLKNSFKKLGTDSIDIYMLHTIVTLDDLHFRIKNGVLDVLKNARDNGKIDFIGLTGHRIPVLKEIIKMNEFDVIEVPYGIGQTSTEELFEVARDYDVGIIAIRTLGGGILINPNKSVNFAKFMNSRDALAYVLSNKNVSSVLVGMSSINHVEENVNAVKKEISLSESERKQIERRAKEFLGSDFCRGCLACMPCDVWGWKFPMDQFFRMHTFFSKYGVKNAALEYKELKFKADNCKKCKECEKKCSYGVKISKRLEEVHNLLMNYAGRENKESS